MKGVPNAVSNGNYDRLYQTLITQIQLASVPHGGTAQTTSVVQVKSN